MSKEVSDKVYRRILKDSWRLIWRSKMLWFFGIFITLAYEGSEYLMIIRHYRTLSSNPGLLQSIWEGLTAMHIENLSTGLHITFSNYPGPFISIGIITLVLAAFLVWLINISQVAVIRSASVLDKNSKPRFADALKTGRRYFWSTLGFNVIQRILTGFLIFVIGLPLSLIAIQGLGGSALFSLILFFLVLAPLAIIISISAKFSIMIRSIEKEKFWSSWYKGILLFKYNWVSCLEMAAIMLLIDAFTGIVLVLSLLVVLGPLFMIGSILLQNGQLAAFSIVIDLGLMLIFIVTAIIGGSSAAFQWGAWTNFYLKISNVSNIKSKIERGWNKLEGLFSNSPRKVTKSRISTRPNRPRTILKKNTSKRKIKVN